MDNAIKNHLKKYPQAREITQKRTLNAKFFDNGDETKTMHAHIGHIHYKDKKDKQFKEINTTLIETATGWEMRQASYEVELPKYADDWFVWINSFVLDPRTGEEHNLPEERIRMRPVGAQHVKGIAVTDPSDPWANKKVLYTNAFGQGIDLAIQARNIGFDKLVVIREKPADLTQDRQFSFEIEQVDFDFKPKKKQTEKTANDLDNEAAKIVQIKAHFDGGRELENQRKFSEAREQAKIYNTKLGELEDDLNRKVWSKRSELKTKDSVIVGKLKKSWFRDFKVWDSGGKRESIEASLKKNRETVILTKTIRKEFLVAAQYPVTTDDTTSYYSGAGDGYVAYQWAADWATTRASGTGNYYSYTAETFSSFWCGESQMDTNKFNILRVFIPIDTSGLSDAAEITAATLYIYSVGSHSGDNDGNDFVTVVQSSQYSTSSLANADFDAIGSSEGVASSERKDMSSQSTEYKTFVLNATGRGWISLTGYTKLGMRTGYDFNNHAIATDCNCGFYARTSEYTGTSSDPYLSITYEAGSTPIGVSDNGSGTESVSVRVLVGLSETGSGVDATPAVQNSLTQTDSGSGADSVDLEQIKSVLETGSGADVIGLVIRAIVSDSATGNDIVSILAQLAISDSGVGTETVNVLANIALTDTGAGNEAVAALCSIAASDSGTANDAVSVLTRLAVSDNGTASEIVSMLANISISETGNGVEAINILANLATIQDNGVGSEAALALIAISISDSGEASEALSALIHLSVNDNGSADEVITSLVNLAIQETGTGSDSVIGGVRISIPETGSGNEAISVLSSIIVSENGTGNESAAIKTLLSVLETASGNDAISVLSRLIVNDSASGSDIVSVIRTAIVQDSGVGGEVIGVLSGILLQDSGVGTDIIQILSRIMVMETASGDEDLSIVGMRKTIQESGFGTEAINLIAQIAVNELATATESIEVVNRMFVADNGQGSDVLRVLARLAIADNATAVEAVNVAARVSVQENGTASEALAIIVSALIQEAGSAIESVKVSNPEKIISDSGMGSDKISVILKKISIADLGSADDVVELLKRVAVSDEAIGIDVASVVANIILSDSGIGTEKIRARWDEWLCKTYQSKTSPYSRKASPYTQKTNPYKKCGQ